MKRIVLLVLVLMIGIALAENRMFGAEREQHHHVGKKKSNVIYSDPIRIDVELIGE